MSHPSTDTYLVGMRLASGGKMSTGYARKKEIIKSVIGFKQK